MSEQVGSIVYTVDVNTSDAIAAERTISASTTKIADNFKRTETQVTKSTRAVNQALTNTSYQIQDIAVQLAGGQNPFLVMAQQIPQIAVGMGAMGAAIGAAVAILGGLAMAVFDTKTALEKAQEAIERVQASITVGANGIANYTEEMRKLRSMSEELARAKLNEVLLDQAAAFKQLRDVGIDAIQSIGGTFTGRTYTDIAAKLGTTKDNIVALREGLVSMNFNPSAEGAAEFARQVAVLDKAVESTDKKGRELVRTLLDISTKYLEGRRVTEQATEALKNNANIVATQAMPGFRDMAEALAATIVKYQSGERAAYRYGLMVKGASEYEQEALLALYDKEQALKKAKEAQDAVTKSLDDYLDKEAEQSAREEEKRQRSREQLTGQVSAVGLTPLQEIEKRYQDELALLEKAEQDKIEIIGTYAERRAQIEKEKTDAIAAMNRNLNTELELVNWESFGNRAAGALAGVTLGLTDGKDAVRALAQSLLMEGLGALIKYGAEQALISAGFIAAKGAETAAVVGGIATQTAAATSATATTTAATVASGAAITSAMAPAAAATSIATGGAAPAAASGITLSTIGLIIGAIVGARALAGAREFGGPVTNGKSYLVGERGPEIFTPGVSGAITSNSALNGGGGVTINNYAAGVEVEPRFDQGRLVEIAVKQAKREIIRDMSNNGQFARSVKANTNTKFTGSR